MQYISPSQYNLWIRSPEEWYKKYKRAVRVVETSTPPMEVGTVFDAMVKSYLVPGESGMMSRFAALTSGVTRAESITDGKAVFDAYKRSGRLRALEEMCAGREVLTELSLKGDVCGIGLSGKPDLAIRDPLIILDWKVNGWYGTASPAPGYSALYVDGYNKGAYRGSAQEGPYYQDWKRQLTIYKMLVTGDTQSPFVGVLEQLVCKRPNVRVAVHEFRIGSEYQRELCASLSEMYAAVNSEHVFRDRTLEESKKLELTLQLEMNYTETDPEFDF